MRVRESENDVVSFCDCIVYVADCKKKRVTMLKIILRLFIC